MDYLKQRSSEQTAVYTYDYVFWVINEGFAGLAGFGLGFGGVLNIILDPIFMFVILPKGQEVTGAAVATMLSNICAALFFIIAFIYLRKKAILSISPKQAKHGLKFMKEIASVGFPSSIMTILASATVSVTNFLIASYGDIPLAAIGIVKKIEMLPLNIGMGLCQGMLPLVAYNYGAKDYKRMRAVINWNLIYGVGFIIVCLCTFEFCAGPVVRLFISDAQTVTLGETFLRILVLSTPFMFISFQTCYTFQAMGKGFESLVLSVCRQGAFNIPLLFFMNAVFGLYGIMWTQLIADMMSTAVALILYTRTMKKLHLTEGSSELASAHKHA